MAELNTTYYKGEDLYSDGDVEEEILAIVRGEKTCDPDAMSFPVLYHLSPVRENIINWYPFRPHASCLEIGAGCGAITGALCKKAEKVTAVDLSKRRSEINFERHEKLPNLELMVGNFHDMEFPERYDYVVLNGVFEYAMSFTHTGHPYRDFLAYAKGLLKPNGIILIAIENRLGLKYFSGAPEDHTNAYFDGLNAYEGNTQVRTFTRSEWVQLMKDCGLYHYRFYYPYPDYKFPAEIFTAESIKSQRYGRKAWNFTDYRFSLFSETQVTNALLGEGIMESFANSFLLEMSADDLAIRRHPRILYAKLNADRREEFAIGTVLMEREGRRIVQKLPLCEKAEKHLESMAENSRQQFSGPYAYLEGELEDGVLTYPMLGGESLMREADKAVRERNRAHLKRLVGDVVAHCLEPVEEIKPYRTEAFTRVFGTAGEGQRDLCVSPANIDLILDNLFPDGGKIRIIDGEWIFPFPVPTAFIVWRMINELYTHHEEIEEFLPRTEFYGEYGIGEEMQHTFWSWSTHFAEEYVGANRLLNRSTPEIGYYLEGPRKRRRLATHIISDLFVDTGHGFSEEEKLTAECRLVDGRFTLHYDLSAFTGIRKLRWDPADQPCRCVIDPAACSKGVLLRAANAVAPLGDTEEATASAKEGDLFLTDDPIYDVEVTGEVPRELLVAGTAVLYTFGQGLDLYRDYCEKLRHASEESGKKTRLPWRKK